MRKPAPKFLNQLHFKHHICEHFSSSTQCFVPEIETRHHMQPDIFLAPSRALQTAVDRLSLLVAHAAQCTRPLGDVVFEEVGTCVGALPQVGRGHVRHAGGFLVVVGDHVVHVRVGVGELLERSVICRRGREMVTRQ